MVLCLRFFSPTSSAGIYGLGIVIGVGLAALRTPLSAQLSANYRDDTEAAFAGEFIYQAICPLLVTLRGGSIERQD